MESQVHSYKSLIIELLLLYTVDEETVVQRDKVALLNHSMELKEWAQTVLI